MKKVLIFSFIVGFSSLMAWAIFKNSRDNRGIFKKDKTREFSLNDTQRVCINELLKIQKFYNSYPIFKARLLKSATPEGGKGEQLTVEVFSDGINYFMDGKIASIVNNNKFFAQIDHESRQVLIGDPNTRNPLGFKFADFLRAFKDSLIECSFKRAGDIATISYVNYIENTITDISYKYSSGEIMRITQTYFDSWDGEEEIAKITEDCIIQSFIPLNQSISSSKFDLSDYIEQRDSTFIGKGICKDYEIADTRSKY